MLRVVAWNMGHQTRERPIQTNLCEVISSLRADVVMLNEYVHGTSRDALVAAMAAIGLPNVLISDRVGTHNQVLVASRVQMVQGDLRGPMTSNGGGASNFLHVCFPDRAIEIVGLRVPTYETRLLHEYWSRLSDLIGRTKTRSIAFAGDLNADPASARSLGGRYLRNMQQDGWNIPVASGAWSFCSGSRIDHVVASSHVRVGAVEYVTEVDGSVVASRDKDHCISDHAALVFEIERA